MKSDAVASYRMHHYAVWHTGKLLSDASICCLVQWSAIGCINMLCGALVCCRTLWQLSNASIFGGTDILSGAMACILDAPTWCRDKLLDEMRMNISTKLGFEIMLQICLEKEYALFT